MFIFVHLDVVRKLLQALHNGFFSAINLKSKKHALNVNGKMDWISIDCLKTAPFLTRDAQNQTYLNEVPHSPEEISEHTPLY